MRFTFFLLFLFVTCFVNGQVSDTLKTILIVHDRIVRPMVGYSSLELDSSILSDYAYQDISVLLFQKGGMYVKASAPNGLATLSIRGLGASHTQIYWNDIPINSPTLGLSDLSSLPVAFFDRVVVNLGGASLANGSGSLGGSVNLMSDNKVRVGFQFSLGHQYNYVLDASDIVLRHSYRKNLWSFQTRLLKQVAANAYKYVDITQVDMPFEVRGNSSMERFGVMEEIAYRINERNDLNFTFIGLNKDSDIPSVIGVSGTKQYQLDKSRKGMLKWRLTLEELYLELGVALFDDNSEYINENIFLRSEFDVKTRSVFQKMAVKLHKNLILSSKLNSESYNVLSSGFENRVNQNRFSIMGKLDYSRNSLNLIACVRSDWVDGVERGVLPSFGYSFFPDKKKRWKLNGNVSKNHRLPSLNDLYWSVVGNTDLKDEQSFNFENGVAWSKDKVGLKAIYYSSLVDDWIQWRPINGIWRPENVKKVINSGVELGGHWETIEKRDWRADLSINYRWTKSVNIEVDSGDEDLINKQLIYVPKHHFSFGLEMTKGRLRMSYVQGLVSRTFIDAINKRYLPYYAPAELSLKYRIDNGGRTDFGLVINNLYNEDYHIQAGYPMPRRNVGINFKYTM